MNKILYRKKPLPPYGKELLKQKTPNEIWLFFGEHAWRYAKNHHAYGKAVLVMPEDKLPDDFYWPVQNTEILIFDLNINASEVLLKRLAWQLLSSGAKVVRLVRLFCSASVVVFYHDGQRGKTLCH